MPTKNLAKEKIKPMTIFIERMFLVHVHAGRPEAASTDRRCGQKSVWAVLYNRCGLQADGFL
jgi:hypothetical protein